MSFKICVLGLALLCCESGACDSEAPAAPVEASRYRITFGAAERVADPGVPIYTWFPDGHISVVPQDGQLSMYWAGASSYRTVGKSLDDMELSPKRAVLEKGPAGAFDNGGAWLMSVFDRGGGRMIGFYHAEDHEWPGHQNPKNIAWKSVAYATSSDGGVSWRKHGADPDQPQS